MKPWLPLISLAFLAGCAHKQVAPSAKRVAGPPPDASKVLPGHDFQPPFIPPAPPLPPDSIRIVPPRTVLTPPDLKPVPPMLHRTEPVRSTAELQPAALNPMPIEPWGSYTRIWYKAPKNPFEEQNKATRRSIDSHLEIILDEERKAPAYQPKRDEPSEKNGATGGLSSGVSSFPGATPTDLSAPSTSPYQVAPLSPAPFTPPPPSPLIPATPTVPTVPAGSQ